eukprot:8815819-Pyramimonas_sp.AAC.1
MVSFVFAHAPPSCSSRRNQLQAAYQQALPAGSESIESLLALAAFALAAAWPPVAPECSPHHAYSDAPSVTGSEDAEVLTEGSNSPGGERETL